MPWSIKKGGGSCSSSQYAVIKDSDGSTAGCHGSKAAAEKQMAALYANEKGASMKFEAPRDDLVRMTTEIRQDDDDGRTLVGYAAVFDRWTEITGWEGHFRERIQKGAFKRTLNNNGPHIKVLFNHGMDPQIGSKPLGKPRTMQEDKRGLFVEVPLDETSYNNDIIASLRSGALDGMSFRMSVIREEWDKLDEELPERTIQEIRLYEFGPVTFPAYEATTAGVRAHAPEAFAAYRMAQGSAPDRRTFGDRFNHGSGAEDTSVAADLDTLVASGLQRDVAVDVVYTPSSWPGWSAVTTSTSNGLTLYVRDEDITQVDVDDENDDTDTTRAESESDKMAAPDDSVETIEDHSSDEDRDSAPDHSRTTEDQDVEDSVESDHSEDVADGSGKAHPSPLKRMTLVRKKLFMDEVHEQMERMNARTQKRYQHLVEGDESE